MLFRVAVLLSLSTVAAIGETISFSLPCGTLITSEQKISHRLSPSWILTPEQELDVLANLALAQGRVMEALEYVEEGISRWKAKFVIADPKSKKRGSALNGLRWAQMSMLTILGLENFPADARERYRKWVDVQLLESGLSMVDHYALQSTPLTLPGEQGFEIQSAGTYPLEALIKEAETIIPGEPYRVAYSPDVLSESNGAAAVDHEKRFFILSHESMTTLAPTFREEHEIDHLRLESFLVQGMPSNFYGFDKGLSQPLPGPGDAYQMTFSHNEPYNYQQETLRGIRLFKKHKNSNDQSKIDSALERIINGANSGSKAALRKSIIGRALAPALSHFDYQAGDTVTVAPIELRRNDDTVLFDTPCLSINQSFYAGIYIQTRGNGRKIPWFVVVDGARMFSLPILDFPVSTAETLLRDMENFGELAGANRLTRLLPLFDAAKLAAKEYQRQAENADHMKNAFDPVLGAGLQWMGLRTESSLAIFEQGMDRYESLAVPATRQP